MSLTIDQFTIFTATQLLSPQLTWSAIQEPTTPVALRAAVIKGMNGIADEMKKVSARDITQELRARAAPLRSKCEGLFSKVRAGAEPETTFLSGLEAWLREDFDSFFRFLSVCEDEPLAVWAAFAGSVPALPLLLDWSGASEFTLNALADDIFVAFRAMVPEGRLHVILPLEAKAGTLSGSGSGVRAKADLLRTMSFPSLVMGLYAVLKQRFVTHEYSPDRLRDSVIVVQPPDPVFWTTLTFREGPQSITRDGRKPVLPLIMEHHRA